MVAACRSTPSRRCYPPGISVPLSPVPGCEASSAVSCQVVGAAVPPLVILSARPGPTVDPGCP
eukprot:8993268-Prorocentrum_lima.AAC.1